MGSIYTDYIKLLTTNSEEEDKLLELVQKERKRFEKTEEYKRHRLITDGLFKKMHEASLARMEEAKKKRPRIKKSEPVDMNAIIAQTKARIEKQIEELPDNIKQVVRSFQNLTEEEKETFSHFAFPRHPERVEEESVPKEIMHELHYLLVQTVLDYFEKNQLTDVDSVSFGADGLIESAKEGYWTPGTDSYLSLGKLKEVKYANMDGEEKTTLVRTIAGESM